MESFATAYPLIFFDGEQEHEKGHIGIHSALSFKRFQALISQKTGIPPNQLSAVFICKKTSKEREKRQKLPINENTNFSIILNQHNPSKEKDCHFMISIKKSKKERKVSKKRSADVCNHGYDDELASPNASQSPISPLEWSSPSRSEGPDDTSSSVEKVEEQNLDEMPLERPDKTLIHISSEATDLANEDTKVKDAAQSNRQRFTGSHFFETSPTTESDNKLSQTHQSSDHRQNETSTARRDKALAEGSLPFNKIIPIQHSEQFTQDRYSRAITQPQKLKPHFNPVLNNPSLVPYMPSINNVSPSMASNYFTGPVSSSPLLSAGFYPSRIPFHAASTHAAFPARDTISQAVRPQLLHVQKCPPHFFPLHSYGSSDSSNWMPASRIQGDYQKNVCEVCYDCRLRNIYPIPFHSCVQDRIVCGFRGPSPAGPIERPGKRRVQVAL